MATGIDQSIKSRVVARIRSLPQKSANAQISARYVTSLPGG